MTPTATPISVDDQWAAAQREFGKKVKTFARNSAYAVPGYDEVDMEQELLVVLWECVVNYDPGKGARFNTYFQTSAKNRIVSLIRRFQALSRTAEVASLDVEAVSLAVDEVFAKGYSAEDTALLRMEVREAVATHGEASLEGRRGRKPKRVA
jgi:DNA-directed RNA polymerase specialized sigma24 family protein